jgi:hypothetical protein
VSAFAHVLGETTLPPNNARRELVDRVLGGRLRDVLQRYRDDGLTLDEMAVRFKTDHDIKVSREALRRWCGDLDVTLTRAAS